MNSLKTAFRIRCRYLIEVIPFVATVCLQTACNASCFKGYTLKENLCVLSVDSGVIDGSGTHDAGATVMGNDADVPPTACTESTFDSTCLTATDCGCDTGFCAAMPGQQGFCTHSGCLQDTSVCPTGWTCMDLSAYGQQGLSICTPP